MIDNIFVTSRLIGAGILISGNSFDKVALFGKYLGLGFISEATHNRVQTNFIVLELKRYWGQMPMEIRDILSGESAILCKSGIFFLGNLLYCAG